MRDRHDGHTRMQRRRCPLAGPGSGPRSLVILSVLSILYVAAFFAAESVDPPGRLNSAVPVALGAVIIAIAVRGLILSRRDRVGSGS